MEEQQANSTNSKNDASGGRDVGKVSTSRAARRGPAPQACTECRRLKLRCNRSCPCATCLKRGVADKCNGATQPEATTDPASLLLNAASATIRDLQERNKGLEAHIQELTQTILNVLHGDRSVTNVDHPLHAELLEMKRRNKVAACIDKSVLQAQLVESFGTLTISNDSEHTSWLGSTASSEFFIQDVQQPGKDHGSNLRKNPRNWEGLPAEILMMGRVYSFTQTAAERGSNFRAALKSAAPPREVAHRLCKNFFTYGSWLASPISPEEFFDETFDALYNATVWTSFTYDRIALFFSVLSVGVLLDFQLEPRHPFAYRFHKIGGGALGMSEFIESPSITSCQALAVICIFHLFSDDPDGPARCWGNTGVLLRMAQSAGLHRNTTLSQQNPKEHQRRARLWWEVVFIDRMQSLIFGRPSGINNAQCDCAMPSEDPADVTYKTEKHVFIDQCVVPVINETLAVKPPSYGIIFKLDKLIRDWEPPAIPSAIDQAVPPPLSVVFYSYACNGYKEITLLYLHRSAFIAALREHPSDPLKHNFAPSVLAVHKAACTVIINIQSLLQQYASLVPRIYIWGLHAFSAAVLLSALVAHAPGCKLAPSAMTKLDIAYSIFEQCKENVRMSTALPLVVKYRNVARKAFAAFNSGQDSQPSQQDREQLSILAGNSQFVVKGSGTESSPSDSTSSNDAVTPPDIQTTLQEHFRRMEWEHQKYDIPNRSTVPTSVSPSGSTTSSAAASSAPATFNLPPAPFGVQPFDATSSIDAIAGIGSVGVVNSSPNVVDNSNNIDILSALNYQATGNGVTFDPNTFDLSIFDTLPSLAPNQLPMPLDGVNYNFNLPSNTEDPLDFLSVQNQAVTPEASWDYAA